MSVFRLGQRFLFKIFLFPPRHPRRRRYTPAATAPTASTRRPFSLFHVKTIHAAGGGVILIYSYSYTTSPRSPPSPLGVGVHASYLYLLALRCLGFCPRLRLAWGL
eukprot:scaffold5659_cov121-Isochrysis_galbana.AAC.6